MNGWFHASDGLYFRRTADGGVEVLKQEPTAPWPPEAIVRGVVVEASGWASIVAHVSTAGDTAEASAAAMTFHAGGRHSEAAKLALEAWVAAHSDRDNAFKIKLDDQESDE